MARPPVHAGPWVVALVIVGLALLAFALWRFGGVDQPLSAPVRRG